MIAKPEKRVIPANILELPTQLSRNLVDYINHTSQEYIPQFSIQSTLTFLGHLYGRRFIGTTGLSTSSYSILVGQSGIGKNYCKEELNKFSTLHTNIIGGATSSSGLFSSFVKNPNLLMLSDEIGDKLNSKDDNNKSLWRMVREASNTSLLTEDAYAGRVNGKIIESTDNYNVHYPCLSILGLTTPKQLSNGLSDSDIESGTLNRFVIVNAFVDEIMDNNHDIEHEPTPELIYDIIDSGCKLEEEKGQKSFSNNPNLIKINFEKDDLLKLKKKRIELLNDENSIYTVRSVEKAMKMAQVLTISEKLTKVPTSFIKFALNYEMYWAYNTKKISEQAGVSGYSLIVEKFLEKLKSKGPEGWDVKPMNNYFRRTLSLKPHERDSMINDLKDDGIIQVEKIKVDVKTSKSKDFCIYVGTSRF